MTFRFPWRTAPQIAHEVDEELAYHLEARVAQLQAAGHPPDEARRLAEAEFGDLDATRRYCREADLAREREHRRRDVLGDLLLDLRYALRALRRRPGVAAVVVGSLALAVGINTAMFSVLNAVLLRPLPYPDPSALVRVFERDEDVPKMSVTYPNFEDLLAGTRTLSALGVYWSGPTQAAYRGTARVPTVTLVSAGFFATLGVAPAIGRTFSAEEAAPGGPAVAVVSHAWWRNVMGSDPEVLERSITMDGRVLPVVGVMPPGFAFPQDAEIWVPDQIYDTRSSSRTSHGLRVVGRRAPGATMERVQAELTAIGAGLARAHPDELKPHFGFLATPLAEELTRSSRDSLVLLQLLVSLVLLIGCANLAFVLLAQSGARSRELALRQALGGSAGRIGRQLLTETAALGLAGGGAGVLLTLPFLGFINRIVPAQVLHSGPVTLDWRVAGFGLALGALAGIAFGLAPVWRAARLSPLQAMQAEGGSFGSAGGRRPFGGVLLVGQYAMSFAALVMALVTTRSLIRLQSVDAGFATEGRVAAELLLPVREGTRYGDYRAAMGFLDRFAERLRQSPEIEAVVYDRTPPLAGVAFNQRILIESGNPLGSEWPDTRTVSPGYFSAMGIPLIRGRDFVRSDSLGSERVGIVTRALADRLWPGQDPVGRVFKRWETDPWITVIGIVGEVRTRLDAPPALAIYLPMYQDPYRTAAMSVIVRGRGPAEGLETIVRRGLAAEDPDLALRNLRTLEAIRLESIALPRFRTRMVMVFGALALLLVVLGVYGVMAYTASLRRQELAIRAALGARRRHLTALFLGRGARIAAVGTVVGIAVTLGLSRVLRSLLFGMSAMDPTTVAMVVPLMLVAVIIACLAPARRASRADPAGALRGDAGR